MAGEVRIFKTCLRVSQRSMSQYKERDVSKEEVLAEFVNSVLQSGEVNGIEFCKLVDKKHVS